jgi:3-hydroxyacyl-CoA dehydrogenase
MADLADVDGAIEPVIEKVAVKTAVFGHSTSTCTAPRS